MPKKNRDYTGLLRTPSSMAWLIGQRARLKGQVDRWKAQLDPLPDKIRQVEAEIQALDAVIPMHRVKVDPARIEGVKPQSKRLLPYGQLTRSLLETLQLADGKPLYTMEIALAIAREANLDLAEIKMSELMDRIIKRLRALVDEGVVERHHPVETNAQGSWSLRCD